MPANLPAPIGSGLDAQEQDTVRALVAGLDHDQANALRRAAAATAASHRVHATSVHSNGLELEADRLEHLAELLRVANVVRDHL